MVRPLRQLVATLGPCLLAPSLLALSPGALQASDGAPPIANGQMFGAWSVACQATAVNQTACVLSQDLLRDSDRAFLAQMLAFWSADGSKLYLAMRVPLGAYLPAGIALRAASAQKVHTLTWQSCTPRFCEALMALDQEIIGEMTGGDGTVIATYRPALSAKPLIFRFNAAAMKDGLDALKPEGK